MMRFSRPFATMEALIADLHRYCNRSRRKRRRHGRPRGR